MTRTTILSDSENLSTAKEINDKFEQLLQQMSGLGYQETHFFIGVAQTAFQHELFMQIKEYK